MKRAPNKPIPELSEKDRERFYTKIKVGTENECWLWFKKSTFNPSGYGAFGLATKMFLSNRIAYFLEHDIDPGELQVLHTCDNPKCCNPRHLFLGTHDDNMTDMFNKGRFEGWKKNHKGCTGSKNPMAIVNEKQVVAIRNDPRSNQIVGEKYGLTAGAVRQIRKRRRWKHVA